jgi:hypothetical protein
VDTAPAKVTVQECDARVFNSNTSVRNPKNTVGLEELETKIITTPPFSALYILIPNLPLSFCYKPSTTFNFVYPFWLTGIFAPERRMARWFSFRKARSW